MASQHDALALSHQHVVEQHVPPVCNIVAPALHTWLTCCSSSLMPCSKGNYTFHNLHWMQGTRSSLHAWYNTEHEVIVAEDLELGCIELTSAGSQHGRLLRSAQKTRSESCAWAGSS